MKTVNVKLIGLEPLATVIAFELSEFLSGIGGFALPRERDVVIDLSGSPDHPINMSLMVNELVRTLDKVGLTGLYVIEIDRDSIIVQATSKERVAKIVETLTKGEARPEVCPHCGFTTPYPEVMREHIKIHYLF
ncbi:MAG: C2H2-type zinc finger protein [Nitrososphaerota archaeon]|nr:hypothetical protein [Candidatus Calditenuaceae archaeon]MDW8072841.1 C2H2-type zinc finger protein [Nitrososphaerota archaeon]